MENFFNKDLNESYDVIILGAGPAGCSAGMYAARDALSVLILEKNFPGGNMAITEHIENYPGFTEPVLGHEITDKFVKHAQKFGAVIRQGNCVDVIDDGIWKSVILEDGRKIKCKALIIAFCATCDGGFFRNKEVIVIGGGDSALEEGIYLTKFASKVTIVHRRNEFRAAKIIQNRAKENKKIHFMTPYVLDEILGENIVTGVKLKNTQTEEIVEYKCDGIFEFIGWDANTDIFTSLLELSNDGFIKASENTVTSISGIFAAGDVRKKGLMQVVTAASDGAVAAKMAEKYINEELKH